MALRRCSLTGAPSITMRGAPKKNKRAEDTSFSLYASETRKNDYSRTSAPMRRFVRRFRDARCVMFTSAPGFEREEVRVLPKQTIGARFNSA